MCAYDLKNFEMKNPWLLLYIILLYITIYFHIENKFLNCEFKISYITVNLLTIISIIFMVSIFRVIL